MSLAVGGLLQHIEGTFAVHFTMAARKSRSAADSSTVPNLPPSSLPFSNLRSSSKRKEMSSYPPINLFGLNLEPRRKAFTAPTRSEEECAECAVVCPQSPCAPVELTSMCTARCVVIACDDPEHDNPSLRCPLIAAGKLHCDLECQEGSTDCPDCNRFDNFVRILVFFECSCLTEWLDFSSETTGRTSSHPLMSRNLLLSLRQHGIPSLRTSFARALVKSH